MNSKSHLVCKMKIVRSLLIAGTAFALLAGEGRAQAQRHDPAPLPDDVIRQLVRRNTTHQVREPIGAWPP